MRVVLRRAPASLKLPPGFLAGYDACAGETYGRLDVPAWGANTMRAEFAVLTGIDEARSATTASTRTTR